MYALVDCNNFYASCERVFNPTLEKKPVVILSNNDGCVIARSNEAKAIGIKMGAPAFESEVLFQKHNVVVHSSNYALYGDMSDRVMRILHQLVPGMEVYSIDEAFLDLSSMPYTDLFELGLKIRQRIKMYTGIPVSIGIATTKTLSKLANRWAKKHTESGVFQINDELTREEILKATLVTDVWGIGPRYTQMLGNHGIQTAWDFTQASESWIRKQMSVVGARTHRELRGQPCYGLEEQPQPKKGIMTSRSFGKPVTDFGILQEAVSTFTARCAEKLRKQQSSASLLSVFIHTNRFQNSPQYYGSRMVELPVASNSTMELIGASTKILKLIYQDQYSYKKAGVMVSGLVHQDYIQTDLFAMNMQKRELDRRALFALDRLNKRHGRDTVRIAAQGYNRSWHLRQEKRSRRYTTRWEEILEVLI